MSTGEFPFADDLGPAKDLHVYDPSVPLRAVLIVDSVAAGPAIGDFIKLMSPNPTRIVGEAYVVRPRGGLDARVSEVMSGGVLSVRPDADAADVVDLMLENRIGAVPVVSEDGAAIGMVSYVDLLRALPLDT